LAAEPALKGGCKQTIATGFVYHGWVQELLFGKEVTEIMDFQEKNEEKLGTGTPLTGSSEQSPERVQPRGVWDIIMSASKPQEREWGEDLETWRALEEAYVRDFGEVPTIEPDEDELAAIARYLAEEILDDQVSLLIYGSGEGIGVFNRPRLATIAVHIGPYRVQQEIKRAKDQFKRNRPAAWMLKNDPEKAPEVQKRVREALSAEEERLKGTPRPHVIRIDVEQIIRDVFAERDNPPEEIPVE
jgi:hypothetical protein